MQQSQLHKKIQDLLAENREKDGIIEKLRVTVQSQHQHWELQQASWEKDRASILFFQGRNSGLEQDNYQLRVQAQEHDEEKRKLIEEDRRHTAILSGELEARDSELEQRTAECASMENRYNSAMREIKAQAGEVARLTNIISQLSADVESKDTQLKSTTQELAIQMNEVKRLNNKN
uniref:Uncharacterized protein n=1 Tax=Bionectria ochroleuca TaxID=29856 RepID=A0A8H7K5C4_BIOOC